jgi:hypothetical protein
MSNDQLNDQLNEVVADLNTVANLNTVAELNTVANLGDVAELNAVAKLTNVIDYTKHATELNLQSPRVYKAQIDDLRVTDEQINEVVENIESTLHGKKLSKSNMLRVVLACMSVTAKMTTLPNSLKKKVLITALERYLEKADLPEELRESLLLLVQEVVGEAIDLFSDVDKGRVVVNVTNNTATVPDSKPAGCCVIL